MMSPPLSLENRLLLACARTDPDVQRVRALVADGPDWQAVLRQAERWGLAPLAYAALRQSDPAGQVPRPVTERLRHLHHRAAMHSAAQRELLRATLVRCAEAGIPVIVLKGAALATLVYPAPTLRPLGHIELLVQRRDLPRVKALLRGLSDAPEAPAGAGSGLGGPRASPYRGAAGAALLDIRDHLAGPVGSAGRPVAAGRIPLGDLWERAQPARIQLVDTLVLSQEDLLLHLALDLATRLAASSRSAGHLRALCDIGETCRRYRDAIDWRRLLAQAGAYELAKQLYYPLRLARDLVGAGVPSEALADLRAGFGRLPLEERLIAAVARQVILADGRTSGPPAKLAKLAAPLLGTRRARDGVRLAGRLLADASRRRLGGLVSGLGPWPARLAGSGGSAPALEAGPPAALGSGATRALGAGLGRPLAEAGPSAPKSGEVAVTYDQNSTDGVGSQLQRIYGLYALSRALQVKYVHTPIGRVGYQGFLPLLAGRTDPDFAVPYNAFFSLPSDDFDLESCERVRVSNLSQETVERYREQAAASGRPLLLQAGEHYGYTDSHPAAYLALRAVSPYRDYRAAGPIRVCIHLRRGDNSVPGRSDGQQRLLPNGYYLRVCGTVLEALRRQGAPFVVRLHTEVPPRHFTLHPGTPGLYFQLDQPSTVDPEEYALEDFEALPNLEMVLNVEPREALDDFATADVLILSLSSLGYLGGLLNPHGLVVYAPWWHPPLPDWLVASEHGDLEPALVATRVADHLRRRS
jgi:hypothetical protein